MNPYLWFVNESGIILDPVLSSNQSIISRNIKDNINENFKIFVDNDRNGDPD